MRLHRDCLKVVSMANVVVSLTTGYVTTHLFLCIPMVYCRAERRGK